MSWRFKVILPILVLNLLAVPLLMQRYLNFYEESLWEGRRLLGQSEIDRVWHEITIHKFTTQGDAHRISSTLKELIATKPFIGLGVYKESGKLVTSKGETPPYSSVKHNQAIIRKTPGGTVMDVTRWIKNELSCQECHDQGSRFIGVIEGTYSLAREDRLLKTARIHTFLFIFSTIFVVFLLTYIFLNIYVTRPIYRFMKALARVQEGDMEVQIPVLRSDEIGKMAEGFNEMVTSLKVARAELELRLQDDMARAEQLATVGEIAAGLAHEVKNPLAGISSALEVIIAETGGKESPYRDVMSQIIEETRRIAAIINQLLDYARPRKIQPQRYLVEALIEDLRSMFAPQCMKKKVTLKIDVTENPGEMFSDMDEIKQVLLNILQNALQAIEAGGMIKFEVEAEEDDVSFRISDNGPGMDEETLKRIFQPFYTTKASGTGLGLAIVQQLVKTMEGKIEVKSTPGEGTCFTITFLREGPREHPDR